MALFILVHGAYHGGWCWKLLGEELETAGARWVAPDLPCDQAVGIAEYADTVIEAVKAEVPAQDGNVVVVGHSLGGLTAPVVAHAVGARQVVFLAAVVPEPGRSAVDATHPPELTEFLSERATRQVVEGDLFAWSQQEARDIFFHDCPDDIATWAAARLRRQNLSLLRGPCPLAAMPAVNYRYIVCRDDRTITSQWQLEAASRLGVTPVVLPGGHSPFLARPKELARVLTIDACLQM